MRLRDRNRQYVLVSGKVINFHSAQVIPSFEAVRSTLL